LSMVAFADGPRHVDQVQCRRSSSLGAANEHHHFGGEARPKLKRVHSNPVFSTFHEAVPMPENVTHNLIDVPPAIRRRLHARTPKRVDVPAPDDLLVEGTILYVAQPPCGFGSMQDPDVEVLFWPGFEPRMASMESTTPPMASKGQGPPPKNRWNARQKKCREIVAQKGDKATMLCSEFNLQHFSVEQLLPEARAVHGLLRDVVHNKSLEVPVHGSESKSVKQAWVMMRLVFEEVGKFLVKYHNHPHGDLQKLCKDAWHQKEEFAEMLIEWVGATDKILPPLRSSVGGSDRMVLSELGRAFSSIISGMAAIAVPERRLYLRQSLHKLPCWKIKIPDAFGGLYLGNVETVQRYSPIKEDDTAALARRCTDAQTLNRFKVLLVQHEDKSWKQIDPLTVLPAGGWVYTVCNLCQDNDRSMCKCCMWLQSCYSADEVHQHMTRYELSMDEVILQEHLANMVLGPPAYKESDTEGALNLKQFTFGKVNAIATSYKGTRADCPKK
jgi:hypothetical protein